MVAISLIGGSVALLLALVHDASGTIRLVVAFITVRGLTWVCQKIAQSLNKDNGELINFAGWSLAAISAIGIVKNAIGGFRPFADGLMAIGNFFKGAADIIDKITFWN